MLSSSTSTHHSNVSILLNVFKENISAKKVKQVNGMWSKYPVIQQWFTGEPVNFGTDSEPKLLTIQLSELIKLFKSILGSHHHYLPMIKKMWDKIEQLRNYFSGLAVNFGSEEIPDRRSISLDELISTFNSALASHYSQLIKDIWNNNEQLRNYFSGREVNFGTNEKPDRRSISLIELISNFKSTLASQCSSIIINMWNNNEQLRNYFSGQGVNFGTKEKPDLRSISHAELISNFKSALSSLCVQISEEMWTNNDKLKIAIENLKPADLKDLIERLLISPSKKFKQLFLDTITNVTVLSEIQQNIENNNNSDYKKLKIELLQKRINLLNEQNATVENIHTSCTTEIGQNTTDIQSENNILIDSMEFPTYSNIKLNFINVDISNTTSTRKRKASYDLNKHQANGKEFAKIANVVSLLPSPEQLNGQNYFLVNDNLGKELQHKFYKHIYEKTGIINIRKTPNKPQYKIQFYNLREYTQFYNKYRIQQPEINTATIPSTSAEPLSINQVSLSQNNTYPQQTVAIENTADSYFQTAVTKPFTFLNPFDEVQVPFPPYQVDSTYIPPPSNDFITQGYCVVTSNEPNITTATDPTVFTDPSNGNSNNQTSTVNEQNATVENIYTSFTTSTGTNQNTISTSKRKASSELNKHQIKKTKHYENKFEKMANVVSLLPSPEQLNGENYFLVNDKLGAESLPVNQVSLSQNNKYPQQTVAIENTEGSYLQTATTEPFTFLNPFGEVQVHLPTDQVDSTHIPPPSNDFVTQELDSVVPPSENNITTDPAEFNSSIGNSNHQASIGSTPQVACSPFTFFGNPYNNENNVDPDLQQLAMDLGFPEDDSNEWSFNR